jgi:CubicO group peptidase (beta-lactamase class C family)
MIAGAKVARFTIDRAKISPEKKLIDLDPRDISDPAKAPCVRGDTLFPVFSVIKAMTATAVHQMVERGRIEYDTPIADAWPEFASHRKNGITLRHVLTHTSGLPLMPAGTTAEDICDWPEMCRRIAALAPISPPGTRCEYHAMTFGWILGEVLRRVDGRGFSQILREDICVPLGIEGEMYCGLPAEEEHRVAVLEELYEPGKEPKGIDDGVARSVPATIEPLYRFMNRGDARRACVPASSGIMTARALARFYAAFGPGGVDGVEMLPAGRVAIATSYQPPAGQVEPPRIAMGFFLGDERNQAMRGANTFGHGGYGGSLGFYDPTHRLAVGFTKNLFSGRGAGTVIMTALRDGLGIER